MSEIRYSLCISENDYNTNEVRNKVWRIADFDFDNKCFITPKYNEKDESVTTESNNPYHIRAIANTLTAYRAEIRSWQTISGINSFTGESYINTESDSLGEFPIEILFLPQINLKIHNSDASVRAILQDGIVIPKYISDNFFIVLNKSNDSYEALLCNRKAFQNIVNTDIYKIQKHCQDMLRTTHSLNLYTINLNEIFDTEHCAIFVDQGVKVPTRYFYKYLNECRVERIVYLRDPDDYAKAYISKYIKNKKNILKISKADAQKWSAMIEDALTNKNELEVFFDATGFEFSDVVYTLNNLSNEIKELYLQDDAFSQIVEKSLLKDPVVLEQCKVEAKKIWLFEHDTERDSIIAQIQTYQNELQVARTQKEDLTRDITKLHDKFERLLIECKELESKGELLEIKKSKIQVDIQSELKHFQEDIVHLAAITALTTSNSDISSELPSPILFQPETNRNVSNSNINEIADFIDDLQDNLITYGLIYDHSYDFSLLLTSTVIAKKQIIICGNQAEVIGNSISLLVNRELAWQVFLPNGYSDINRLISLINKSTGKVFVIYNALETFSDSIFLSLVKYCKDKILVFSCESHETYRHLPSHWVNYAVFFYTDFVWSLPNDDDLRKCEFDILEMNQTYKAEKNEFLMKVAESKLIKPVQINNLIKLNSIYKTLNSNADMTSFPLLCNIYASLYGEKDVFFEIVEKTVTNENIVEMLKDEFIYE